MRRKDHSRRTEPALGLGGKADTSIVPKATFDSLSPTSSPRRTGDATNARRRPRREQPPKRAETAEEVSNPLAHRLPSTPRLPLPRDCNLPASPHKARQSTQRSPLPMGPAPPAVRARSSAQPDQQRLLPALRRWVPHRRVGREAAGARRAWGGGGGSVRFLSPGHTPGLSGEHNAPVPARRPVPGRPRGLGTGTPHCLRLLTSVIHDSARRAQWERKSTAPQSQGARALYLPEPGRRKCDQVASAWAKAGYVLSRTLPNSGKGVRHSSGEEERASTRRASRLRLPGLLLTCFEGK